jgi:nucleoside-diphosphate-sugar epimerase
MRVFVTGGSGFVGGHLIERLVRDGHEVVAMARSDRSAERVAGYGATPSRTDLDRVGPTHLEGCDAVIHAAAHVEEHGSREEFWRVNVEGTQRMLDAAKRAGGVLGSAGSAAGGVLGSAGSAAGGVLGSAGSAAGGALGAAGSAAGVKRFVHVGTEAILLNDTRDLIDVDESFPVPKHHRFLYSETKAEAEARVLAANDDELTTIALRPRLVWGPRDETILPAIARMVDAGSFAWIDGGRARTSTTHVHNLVEALVLALTSGEGGRAYFVADDGTRTLKEFLSALAATRGIRLPKRSVPSVVLRPLARVLEKAWKLARRPGPAPLTPFAVCVMSRSVTIRTDRARRELGYAPIVGVDEGLRALAGE